MTATGAMPHRRVGSLDSLRGIAILLVVLVHTLEVFSVPAAVKAVGSLVGNLGVQLFFIVSAYTMCLMWHGRADEPHKALRFYVRRFARIALPYWAAMAFYGCVIGWHPANGAWAAAAAVNALFLHGFTPAFLNAIVPGGWSIAAEMNFYLLFPLLMLLEPLHLLLFGFAWAIVGGMIVGTWLDRAGVDGAFLFYSLLSQLPVFVIGILFFEWDRRPVLRRGVVGVVAAAWAAIAFAGRHFGLHGRPIFWIEIVILAGFVRLCVRHNLALAPLSWIGRRSYSMYLLHFAVLWGMLHLIPAGTSLALGFPAVAAGAAAVATIGLLTVETWGQALGRRIIARFVPG